MPIKGRVAITGRPGVGKTTVIERLLEILPLSAGGLITKEIRVCGHRVGFSLRDVASGEEGILAHLHHRDGPKVGRYTVDLRSLEEIGVRAILRAVRTCDLVVIDEIAPMELSSAAFVPAVEEALESAKALMVSTHANADHPIAHRVRRELQLVRIKLSNRDQAVIDIAACFGVSLKSTPGTQPGDLTRERESDSLRQ
jgi:nucleoside-triphosphatase